MGNFCMPLPCVSTIADIPIQAAMSLQNNFPKSRKYYFWAIFLCYLITVDPASSDSERKLFGTLAYRMISKAADSVPSDPVGKSVSLVQLLPWAELFIYCFFTFGLFFDL